LPLGTERRLGDRIARSLFKDPDLLDDPLLQQYVDDVFAPVFKAARARGDLDADMAERFGWRLFLGKDRTINAFALPGGYFGVHAGLINAVATRDELASVLAHELSHVTQRHISRLISKQGLQTPWVLAGLILATMAARGGNADATNAAIVGSQAAAQQQQLNFSRDMEREADRVGYQVLVQAGYSPQGMTGMFERLQNATRLTDSGSLPYLRSHPLSTERIADAQSRSELALSQRHPTPTTP
jgi:predicted Zn-dependent protease